MKLELKHLAPYLPYELEIAYKSPFRPYQLKKRTLYAINIDFCLDQQDKPILYPIEDYIHFNDIIDEMTESEMYMIDIGQCFPKAIRYSLVEKMLNRHIDVFGLIKEGLAIDINTL